VSVNVLVVGLFSEEYGILNVRVYHPML